MAQPNPKLYQTDQVHFTVIHVNYNDAGISTGVRRATLPASAIIVGTDILITTAFNGGSTNVLTCGGGTNFNEVVAAADVDETATGLTQNVKPTGAYLGRLAADSDLYVKFAQTGTPATTGSADIIVKYIPVTNVA